MHTIILGFSLTSSPDKESFSFDGVSLDSITVGRTYSVDARLADVDGHVLRIAFTGLVSAPEHPLTMEVGEMTPDDLRFAREQRDLLTTMLGDEGIDADKVKRVLAWLMRNEGVSAEQIERAVASAADMTVGQCATLAGDAYHLERRAFLSEQVGRLAASQPTTSTKESRA